MEDSLEPASPAPEPGCGLILIQAAGVSGRVAGAKRTRPVNCVYWDWVECTMEIPRGRLMLDVPVEAGNLEVVFSPDESTLLLMYYPFFIHRQCSFQFFFLSTARDLAVRGPHPLNGHSKRQKKRESQCFPAAAARITPNQMAAAFLSALCVSPPPPSSILSEREVLLIEPWLCSAFGRVVNTYTQDGENGDGSARCHGAIDVIAPLQLCRQPRPTFLYYRPTWLRPYLVSRQLCPELSDDSKLQPRAISRGARDCDAQKRRAMLFIFFFFFPYAPGPQRRA